jgi:hypothetical protein
MYILPQAAAAREDDVSMLGPVGLGPSGQGSDGGVLLKYPPTDQGALKKLMEDIYDGDFQVVYKKQISKN